MARAFSAYKSVKQNLIISINSIAIQIFVIYVDTQTHPFLIHPHTHKSTYAHMHVCMQ